MLTISIGVSYNHWGYLRHLEVWIFLTIHWKDPCLWKVCTPHNILFINYVIYSIGVLFFFFSFFVELSVFEDLEILDLRNNKLNGSKTIQGREIKKPWFRFNQHYYLILVHPSTTTKSKLWIYVNDSIY